MKLEAFIAVWALHQREAWDGGNDTAVDWARAYFAYWYAPSGPNGQPWVNQSYSLACRLLRDCGDCELELLGQLSEETGAALVKRAPLDHDCDNAARAYLREAATAGWPLPKSMLGFVEEVVAGKARGRGKGKRYWSVRSRNLVGAGALRVLTQGFELNATRNASTKARDSACDVLAQVTSGNGGKSFTYNSANLVWANRAALWTEFVLDDWIAVQQRLYGPLLADFYLPLLEQLEADGVGL